MKEYLRFYAKTNILLLFALTGQRGAISQIEKLSLIEGTNALMCFDTTHNTVLYWPDLLLMQCQLHPITTK